VGRLTRARAWFGLFLALLALSASRARAQPAPARVCVNASAIAADQPAPCSGVLLSVEKAREYAACAAVRLPGCKSDALRDAEVCAAQRGGLAAKLAAAEAVAGAPPPWWRAPLIAGGSALAGVALGWVAASFSR